jgi:hypothetical protein
MSYRRDILHFFVIFDFLPIHRDHWKRVRSDAEPGFGDIDEGGVGATPGSKVVDMLLY